MGEDTEKIDTIPELAGDICDTFKAMALAIEVEIKALQNNGYNWNSHTSDADIFKMMMRVARQTLVRRQQWINAKLLRGELKKYIFSGYRR